MSWMQDYDPFGSPILSPLVATIPVVVLLGSIGFFHLKAHIAALLGLLAALAVATVGFNMPPAMAVEAAGFGAAYGLFPIGWIILNIMFLYNLTNERGQFDIMRKSIAGVTKDSRLQLLLIAFCFGAFFEGAAGFGAPVAVAGAMLIGLGFTRLQASGLALIANTAPVAFGALGTPIVTLAAVTGLPVTELSAVVGRQIFVFALVIPMWLLIAYCGWRRALEVWPAALVVGVVFATVQLLVSNFHGPWIAAISASLASMAALIGLLQIWRPATIMAVNEAPRSRGDEPAPIIQSSEPEAGAGAAAIGGPGQRELASAWAPWLVLMIVIFLWGLPSMKTMLDGLFSLKLPLIGLDGAVVRMPPVVPAPEAEKAIYNFNLLSATGTAILFASIIGGFLCGANPVSMARTYLRTLRIVIPSLITIAAMLALGYLTRFSGADAAMGLAFAQTGTLYPFFGALLGWLGVAVTGSDTASNVLFGGLQKVTSTQLGLSPIMMAGANSTGGVMGKMIDAQSIVVASTATQWFGQESRILRYVFLHSLVLGALVGVVVMLQAYVPPFTQLLTP